MIIELLRSIGLGAVGGCLYHLSTRGFKLLAETRVRAKDPRVEKHYGDVRCPQCKKLIDGGLTPFRFCNGPESDCFEYDGPHQHVACDGLGCDWRGIVKP